MKKLSFLLPALLWVVCLSAQISLSSEKPGLGEEITLVFKADEGNAVLKGYTGDVYAHTGLITDKSSHSGDWKHVVSEWGENKASLKLTRSAADVYKLTFRITDFYLVEPNTDVKALAFVFRSADGALVGKTKENGDIFYYLKDMPFQKPPQVRDTCLAPEPDWVKNANIYEVNVRQYSREGTLNAVAQQLPRLRKMGVDILWFMPIQPIGIESRKGTLGSYYAIKDYTSVNPEFGTLADFIRLVNDAHALGMKVVLDWVGNHTARDHTWVKQHPDWYNRDEKGVIIAPYDWTDVADLNYDKPAMRAAMQEAMLFWIRETNIDGFRCDVAGEVPVDFWENARTAIESVKPVWMLAEESAKLWLNNKAFNTNYGWPFHHLMNDIAKGKQPASKVFDMFREAARVYPKGSYPMQFITNHDENSWNGTEYERLGEGVKAFSVLYYAMPGMPLIYSGQESALNKRLQFFEKDPIDWGSYALADFYTRLNALKHENRALWNGRFGGDVREIKHYHPENVVAFVRQSGDNKVLTLINLSGKSLDLSLQLGQDAGVYRDFFEGTSITLPKRVSMPLGAWEYKVFVFEKTAPEPVRKFKSMEKTGTGLRIQTNDGAYTIDLYSQHAIAVAFEPAGESNPPSEAIAVKPMAVPYTLTEQSDGVRINTNGFSIDIQHAPFNLTFYYKGQKISQEAEGFYDDGIRRGFRFQLDASEQLYGGGERVLGMNRRGVRMPLYNRASYGYEGRTEQMYYSLPIAVSSKKYMIVFDNGASGFLDMGATKKDVLSFEASGGRMAYCIVAADQWPALAEQFTALTGRQPLPPRWALGNIVSRMGYHSQAEVENVVKKYQADQIPLDAVVLDLFWFGASIKGTLGNFDWHRDSFPRPETMMATLKSQGVKTVLITEPFILKGSKSFEEAVRLDILGKNAAGNPYLYDFYFGYTGLIDVFKPEARQWFWNIYRKHTLSGVEGWWGDLGEPEVHPDDLLHVNGRAEHLHNLYGHEWAKLVYEGYQKDFPTRRPLILMRSGFVGSQRYGIIPWSGDVNRSWGGLKPQVEIALSMGIQGLAYMHSDLGGFAGNYRDAELYTRWLQYGVFQPVFRTHAQESVPAEPVFWDQTTKDIARRYIQLRYAMLPYNYSLLYENNQRGLPMMRPLFYTDNNPSLLTNTGTYLWGDAFLVSPVVEKGAVRQAVHFPVGGPWINFWNEQAYPGGQTLEVPVNLQEIPVFVRAGAFIPMCDKPMRSTDEYDPALMSVHYYHHPAAKNGMGMLYEDDGQTPDAVAAQQYSLTRFSAAFEENTLRLRHDPEGFQYVGKPTKRSFQYVVHGLSTPVKSIRLLLPNGKTRKLKTDWQPGAGKPLVVLVDETTARGLVIELDAK